MYVRYTGKQLSSEVALYICIQPLCIYISNNILLFSIMSSYNNILVENVNNKENFYIYFIFKKSDDFRLNKLRQPELRTIMDNWVF